MVRAHLLILISLIATSCSQSPALTNAQSAQIENEIQEMLHAYNAEIKTSGLMAEFRYLDDSPQFYWIPPGFTSPLSYDSVTAIIRQNAGKYQRVDNSFDELRIIPLTAEIATYSGRLRSIITDTANHVTNCTMIESGVLIKRTDGWKLLSGQTSLLDRP